MLDKSRHFNSWHPAKRIELPNMQQYADRAPTGYSLLADDEPAKIGDLAYVGHIGGCWVRVKEGQNIAEATLDELLGTTSVLALARRRAQDGDC